jgi:thioredoxin-dependent peroxiredoxin
MPPFALRDAAGHVVESRTLLQMGKHAVVLYFYPKDDTPVCTREACGFRDETAAFEAAGAAIVGISSDDASSHARFAERYGLPFLLLSDPGGEVAKRFGVRGLLGFGRGRETFVVDREGIIRARVRGLFSADRHIREALAVARELGGGGAAAPE